MRLSPAFLSLLLLLPGTGVYGGEVEVLHWWTSGGEAKSNAVLKEMLEKQGHTWKDFAVAGGGGESAMTVLKTRAVSGNPPSAAQIKGHDIQEWASLGFLANLNGEAAAGQWDRIIPPMITRIMKYNDEYVAVPVNVHRVNWIWANPEVFRKSGAQIPTNLEQFFSAAEKIKAAGFIPLAYGGQPWQDVTVFETLALDLLGPQDYVKAFVDLDMATLSGDKMVQVFSRFQQLHDYIDASSPGRDWNAATSMVINGEAAMQIMGDWAKGEFSAAGKKPGKDYLCIPALGTAGEFIYNIDSFVFFELSEKENIAAQQALAKTILDPEFQQIFNLNKGSIPVRTDLDMAKFDQCAVDSMREFKSAAGSGDLVPSLAHGMATTSYAQAAIFDVVSNFFNDRHADPRQAAQKLAKAVKAAL